MKNIESWKPSKFILHNKGPRAYEKNIYPGSFLIVSILAKRYFDVISKYAKGRLLDLGCGNVPLYEFYKSRTSEAICVDWENTYHKNDFIDYQFNLNEPFPENIGKFDTILTTDVIEHIENPDVFFDEISKSLEIGGKLILSTPFLYWVHEAPYDFQRFTEFKLKKYCEKNSLKILELTPYGGVLEAIADLISKLLANTKLSIKIFNKIVPKIVMHKWFACKQARTYPLGYILVAEKSDNVVKK